MQRRSAILGTGHYVPRSVITNHDLSRVLDTSDAWITERTGIARRRIAADGEVTSDMAAHASRAALEAAECDAKDVDLVIVATFTPDSPSAAMRRRAMPVRSVIHASLVSSTRERS